MIFLVGYMGCGKSTLGRRLARRLGIPYVDTDTLVEQREGASVVDVFKYEGERHFREVEREELERVAGCGGDAVISTGGGLPTWRDNMEWMNGTGTTVYLRRTARNIASRLSPYGRQKRPRLRGLSDGELVEFMTRDIADRERYYTKAIMTIDCEGKSDGEICDEIEAKLKMKELLS